MPNPLLRLAAGVPAPLQLRTRITDYLVMLLAVILGRASIVFFFWEGRPTIVPMEFSAAGSLWCNALLSLFFFIQHSLMVRRSVRARLTRVIPVRSEGRGDEGYEHAVLVCISFALSGWPED